MRTVAFYLPQFHRIRENDAWWGEGFTEWVNVRRARPQFLGHLHPRKPTLPLGEYDLTDPNVQNIQSELAKTHGIDAFCIYFYWFDGRRLLEKPVEAWRRDATLLPYCLSWANESWTRRWDGKAKNVLMPQDYKSGFEDSFFNELLPHLTAPHYLQQDGKPILLVHRVDLIPDPKNFAQRLRDLALTHGLGGLHMVAVETKFGMRPGDYGFDAVAEFPPVGANTIRTAYFRPIRRIARDFRGRLMSYDRIVKNFRTRRRPPFTRYRGVMPGWDNTARRQEEATIYIGATPAKYGAWLAAAREDETALRGDRGIVFINAWNEWAEGAYLEPDEGQGVAYLNATAGRADVAGASLRLDHGLWWGPQQARSIAYALAASLLNLIRRVRRTLSRRS